MLFGDPSKFAIAWEIVDEWSTSSLKNGVLDIYINFTLLGNHKNIVHELGSNLKELLSQAIKHRAQSSDLDLRADRIDSEVFACLHEYTFPKEDRGQPSSWQYLAAPYSVYDEGDCIFLVRDGEVDRLYYGSDAQLKGAISLPAFQYENVVQESLRFFEKSSIHVP